MLLVLDRAHCSRRHAQPTTLRLIGLRRSLVSNWAADMEMAGLNLYQKMVAHRGGGDKTSDSRWIRAGHCMGDC